MSEFKVTIAGAGRVGIALAATLARDPAFKVRVLDRSEDALDGLRDLDLPVTFRVLSHDDELHTVLCGDDLVVAAVPDAAVAPVAEAARRANVHYLDFIATPVSASDALTALSQTRAVLAGCGVSPGLVGTLACSLLGNFSPVSDLLVRVGALPRYPTNRLGYGQIWHVDGLLDEYTRTGTALRDGAQVDLAPLEDYERLTIDGIAFEAFTTSGGMGDLDAVARFAPRNVTLKTLRYPGHLDYMRFLMDDLGLRHRRDMLRSLLYNGLPVIEDDVLHILLTARGMRGRQPTERTLSFRFGQSSDPARGNALTSVATGYAATMIRLLADGQIAATGKVDLSAVKAEPILESPFIAPLIERSPDKKAIPG